MGLDVLQLGTAQGVGAGLGVDIVGTANYQVIKLGISDSGMAPVQVGPSNAMPITGTAAVSNFPASQAVTGAFYQAKQPVQVAGADGTVNIVGTVPVSLSAANGTINIAGTLGTINVNNFPAKQVVSVAGADGTFNLVGTAPILFAASSTFTLGTVAFAGTPGVALTGANGTVNVVGTVPVNIAGTLGTVNINNFPAKQAVSLAAADGTANIILTGANGTVNVVGTIPILYAASSTFTLGTVAFAGTPGVALTGANGTVNVVGTVPVSLSAANGTVNIQGTPPVSVSGANGTVNIVGTVPVSLSAANGTVNVNGTATIVLIGANGTVNVAGSATIAAGAAPNSGLVVLAVYNTAAPAPTSGQSAALQSDYASSLFVAKRRAQSKSVVVACTTTQTLLAAQASGVFADLAGVVITISAVSATGFSTFNLSDGTIVYPFAFTLTGTLGNAQIPSVAVNFDPPIPATNAATPWVVRQSGTLGTAQFIGNFVLQKQS